MTSTVSALLKSLLWLFVTAIFLADAMKILHDLSLISGSAHQEMIAKFFRSSFGLFELIMLCLIVFFMIKYPARRARLASLLFFHVAFVLVIPMALRDFTWMAVLYPWPQTLLAFDPKTPALVLVLSLIVGFVAVPFLTWRWGARGFCGYVCPHGAYYSEAYGRLYHPKPGKLKWMKRSLPGFYFGAMVVAALLILVMPQSVESVRGAQKVTFFITSQFLYLIVGVPLIGARSYCTHACPLGYEVSAILKIQSYFRKRQPLPAHRRGCARPDRHAEKKEDKVISGRFNIYLGLLAMAAATIAGFALGQSLEPYYASGYGQIPLWRYLTKSGHTHGMSVGLFNIVFGLLIGRAESSALIKRIGAVLAALALCLPIGVALRGLTAGAKYAEGISMIGGLSFLAACVVMVFMVYSTSGNRH